MKKISLLSMVIFFIDRVIKIIITKTLKLNVKNKVINNFFYLTYCKNEGAAFSLFYGKSFLLILITFIFLYIIYKLIKSEKNLSKIKILNYSLLIGGILGNLIDRIFYGYVIDYLDFKIFNYNFAIFNFADLSIVLGVIFFLFSKGSGEVDSKNRS